MMCARRENWIYAGRPATKTSLQQAVAIRDGQCHNHALHFESRS